MSPSRRIAEEFIKDQVRIMGEYGKAPKLSAKRYQEVVAETERSFESLRSRKETPVKPKAKAKAASRK
jgi:hypothetical protein